MEVKPIQGILQTENDRYAKIQHLLEERREIEDKLDKLQSRVKNFNVFIQKLLSEDIDILQQQLAITQFYLNKLKR
jgi:uncharacterized protein YlxW (UPF0749 family)